MAMFMSCCRDALVDQWLFYSFVDVLQSCAEILEVLDMFEEMTC